MSMEEQAQYRAENYTEALRYLDNARAALQNAGKEGRLYKDRKYVRAAAGTAYSGVLLAIDSFLKLKDIKLPKARKKSIDWYREAVSRLDKKLLAELNAAYDTLHLAGYYDGSLSTGNMQDGLSVAEDIINRLRP